ncbi:MAG: hypothetical protein MK207_15315 [Saprospiraceae bacterium]|nr:hypothetical protein [Saprospiraceae bacterium]
MTIIFLLLLAFGILLNGLLIIIGSIASRKLNFKFSYLSLFSLIIYLGISYWGSVLINPVSGITLAGLIGLFEATMGFKLMLKFNANIEDFREELRPILDDNYNPHPGLVMAMVLAYMLIGWFGTLLV